MTVAGFTLAGVLVGGMGLKLRGDGADPDRAWAQCLARDAPTGALATNAYEALSAVRAERGEAQRQLQAQVRALGQLAVDWRWQVPEQRQWLELASEQTQTQIDQLQTVEEDAGGTEGCLEQF